MSQASEPTVLRLFRASPIGDQVVPQITIEIHDEIPECNSESGVAALNKLRQLYRCQAEAFAEALFRTLPGGSIDALLGELMRRKASLFRVPFVTTEEGD